MLATVMKRRRKIAFFGAVAVIIVALIPVAIRADGPGTAANDGQAGITVEGVSATSTTAQANIADFGGTCDGVHDDRYALRNAMSYLAGLGGGVLNIPAGDCRIYQTAAVPYTYLPGNITIRGVGASSRLMLACEMPNGYNELFRIKGDNITIEDVSLIRSTACSGVMINIFPNSNFTVSDVIIDGQSPTMTGTMHGMVLANVAGGVYNNLTVANSTLRNLRFGLFQASAATTNVDGIYIDGSTFTGNGADDLEFNAPKGVMKNVFVRNSTFANNLSTAAASGFAVGFANVQNATVSGNTFNSYSYEPVHIEDRSSNIFIQGNRFTNSFTTAKSWASHVFIISDSHFITVQDNVFDSTGNTNRLQAVYAGDGGAGYAKPSDITITNNTYILRPNAVQLYASGVPRVTTSGSVVTNIP